MSVPDRFHVSFVNDIVDFTLVSDVAAETAYPLEFCQNQISNRYTIVDMTGETLLTITSSLATEKQATCFAIHNHNFPIGTTARLYLYSGENQTGTVVFDSTAELVERTIPIGSLIAGYDPIEGAFEEYSHLKPHFSIWFETVVYKSFKIEISNSSGFTDDLLVIDKLWLGFAFCPSIAPDYGITSEIYDDTVHRDKKGGGIDSVEGTQCRTLLIDFSNLENSERHTMRLIFDRAKKSGDVLITVDPNDTMSMNYEKTSIFKRTSNLKFSHALYNRNTFGLSLKEN